MRSAASSRSEKPTGNRLPAPVAAFLAACVRSGASIVFAGAPGSGKTTMGLTLLRLHEPTHGEVLLVEIKTVVHGRRCGQSGRGRPRTDCFVLAGGRTSVAPKQLSQAAHRERTSGSPK